MKRLKGFGRDIPNKHLSIHLRTILPVHNLTVIVLAATCSFTILSVFLSLMYLRA